MDTREKLNDAEKETMLLVIGELAQEQANNTKVIHDLITTVNIQTGTLQELKEKIDKPKPIIAFADTGPTQEIIKKRSNRYQIDSRVQTPAHN
jgi:hypothetical protein